MKKCVGPDFQRPERRKRGGPVVCKAPPGPCLSLHEIYCEVMATVILMTRGNAFAKPILKAADKTLPSTLTRSNLNLQSQKPIKDRIEYAGQRFHRWFHAPPVHMWIWLDAQTTTTTGRLVCQGRRRHICCLGQSARLSRSSQIR